LSNGENGVACHFYVRGTGAIEQFLDSAVQANAQYAGNAHGVSIETEGLTPDQTPWNSDELLALERLVNWCQVTHGIPKQMCASPTSAGVGYHSMWGVPDHAPGGWNWDGHTCPGAPRIAQIPALLAGPPPTLPGDPMSASVNADGRAEYFDVVGGVVQHWWQARAGSWSNTGHALFDMPAGKTASTVASYAEHPDGHLLIVVRFSDGSRSMRWQLTPGGAWSGWAAFG
jgi:hypothetical protein